LMQLGGGQLRLAQLFALCLPILLGPPQRHFDSPARGFELLALRGRGRTYLLGLLPLLLQLGGLPLALGGRLCEVRKLVGYPLRATFARRMELGRCGLLGERRRGPLGSWLNLAVEVTLLAFELCDLVGQALCLRGQF